MYPASSESNGEAAPAAMDYSAKPAKYFSGIRSDFIAAIPNNPAASILELGCAYGGTGELALSEGKCRRYVGIEIDPEVAAVARGRLTEVIQGNVETIEFPWQAQSFDVLVMGEVLEHLIDPWGTLQRLLVLVRPGGLVMASSPNISHYKIILELFAGRWTLQDRGPMDRTHLRWFTPSTFTEMFERAGVVVDRVGSIGPFGTKARIVNALTGSKLQHLLISQIALFGHRA